MELNIEEIIVKTSPRERLVLVKSILEFMVKWDSALFGRASELDLDKAFELVNIVMRQNDI